MRVLLTSRTEQALVDIDGAFDATATLADLIAIAGLTTSGAAPAAIDGRTTELDAPLAQAGLFHGSTVRLDAGEPTSIAPLRIDVVAGLNAGHRLAARSSTTTLGRGHDADAAWDDPALSRLHATIERRPDGTIGIRDHQSRNGVRRRGAFVQELTIALEDEVDIGASRVRVRRPARRTAPLPTASGGDAGRIAFNRSPRLAEPPAGPPIAVPAAARSSVYVSPFSWATFLAPLVMGGVLALLFNPMFAVFALLSPVVMIGSWLEQRRRRRRARRASDRSLQRDLRSFAVELDRACAAASDLARRRAPDLADLIDRCDQATAQHARLWERRPVHDDFLQLRIGSASIPWCPPLDGGGDMAPAARTLVDERGVLADAPVVASVKPGSCIGIAGEPAATRAVARALVIQAALLHGPADLHITVREHGDGSASWRSALRWLPHRDGGRGAASLVLVDALGGTIHRSSDELETSGTIHLASTVEELPHRCTTVIELHDGHGRATVTWPSEGRSLDGVLVDGTTASITDDVARRLARFVDPELDAGTAALPTSVTLVDVLEREPAGRGSMAAAWRANDGDHLHAVIGATGSGPFAIDLVHDGPHALIAGTTGAGKSELLRTLVCSLAATRSPDDVTFFLIDYKGGSAFDVCAALPHVVGFVTDLDDHLAARALRSLDAELRRRERVLRASGSVDLIAHRARRRAGDVGIEPLPRMVVVIDEFATLVNEVAGFVDALVSIAQRGRSLGVHLVLATQRPRGAVNDNIRTNANLRIALRVLDRGDSTDVIGCPDAATLPRCAPGRAIAVIGSDEPRCFQTAAVSTDMVPAHQNEGEVRGLRARRVDEGQLVDRAAADRAPRADLAGHPRRSRPSSIAETVVERAAAAMAELGLALPARPWVPPLPDHVSHHEVRRGAAQPVDGALAVPIGLADLPDQQRTAPWCWHPARGPLVLIGSAGSGTRRVLTAIAEAFSAATAGRSHHYVVSDGAGPLATLAGAPHTGAVIALDDRARIDRLVGWLADELRRRAQGSPADDGPPLLLLISSAAQLRAAHDDLDGLRTIDALVRVAVDGARHGIHVAIAADRPPSVPASLLSTTPNRLVLRLADRYDATLLGITDLPPDPPPGRAVDARGVEVQLLQSTTFTVDRLPPPHPTPHRIELLPDRCDLAALGGAAVAGQQWRIPFAIGDHDLTGRTLVLGAGDHLLVTGPPGSGRTTLLATIACQLRAAGIPIVTNGLDLATGRPEVTADADGLRAAVEAHGPEPLAILIDDADAWGDDALAETIAGLPATHHVIAAGNGTRLRARYGHWTRALAGRLALTLRPDRATLAEHPGARARTAPAHGDLPAGRGLLLTDGDAEWIQIAT